MTLNHAQSKLHRRNGLRLRLPPLALVIIIAILMWAASLITPSFNFSLPMTTVLSLTLGLIGAVICFAAIVSFRQAKTTINPMKPDSTSSLVVSGIYKYTRNPMYLGLVLVLLAWAAYLSNVTALALLPAFIVYIDRFQIRPEENALVSLFPQEYPRYRVKVRRWI